MRCPVCHSSNIVSNKLEIPDGREASHVVKHAREFGHPMVAGITAIAWIGANLVNHLRKDYRCADFGHTFNDD